MNRLSLLVPIHKIDHLLAEGHNSTLARLLKTAANQKQWTAELRALIDPDLRAHVEVSNVRGHQAHILCRSAAVATRLRFLSADLMPELNRLASFGAITELRFTVAGHSEQV